MHATVDVFIIIIIIIVELKTSRHEMCKPFILLSGRFLKTRFFLLSNFDGESFKHALIAYQIYLFCAIIPFSVYCLDILRRIRYVAKVLNAPMNRCGKI